jgi:HemY protein
MKAYRWLLVLLALALAAALLAWAIGKDPGYVLIQRGRWTVETTLVFAVGALLAIWLVASFVLWLARWPLGAMARRTRRRERLRFAHGALALAEGRALRAENLLLASSRLRSVRVPALLGAWYAARQRGDGKRQGELLARLAGTGEGEVAATVLRAQAEFEDGRAGAAIELLGPLERTQKLPPAGARTLIEALAARGRAREALPLLPRVRRSQLLSETALEAFEARVLAQALASAPDAALLAASWAELSRAQRRQADVALAYARRAAALRLGDAAAHEVEAVLKRAWSDPLVLAYAALDTADRGARLRHAEAWLKERPASAGLLLALGRLCRGEGLWGKCEEYLRRALAAGAGAPAWEELARAFAAQGDAERASTAYANAIAVARGEPPAPLSGRVQRDDLSKPPPAAEERSEHGIPRLPAKST